ncbi:hypothetical protein NEHOM01_2202 [Nematocida homosporus]|uniref:uncharacterized protein n=1 Tax=Nematocida homosporus TaxID=1912981 RepID=UPI002220C124|nr:uncharacterized protein NEHOM01_2202 [Nematocida homosporus]KAI5187469.1 hypothetical protein NEHOM01_2202 [Nematocida homosporus]
MTENERKDILICGASGFTGRKLLEHILLKRKHLSVGILCRTQTKIDQLVKELAHFDHEFATHCCGVDKIEKLAAVFYKYKVVINCIGPFIYTGLPVIEAAIRAQTDYVDCTGEPGFMQKSFEMFEDKAKTAGVRIVHACGFDSLPLDIGMVYTMQEIAARKGEVSNLVAESYLHLKNTKINVGTFKTIIASIDTLKSKPSSSLARKEKDKELAVKSSAKSSRRKVKKMPFYAKKTGMYAMIFPGSDSWVLRKTRQVLPYFPVCHCYISIPGILGVLAVLFLGLLIGAVYILPCRLREHAYGFIDWFSFGLIREKGPTEDEISSSGFETKIIVNGKDKDQNSFEVTTIVSGPDPGYITTPAALLVSAETILANQDLQSRPGVHTPGSLFYDTDIIAALMKESIMFCVASEK